MAKLPFLVEPRLKPRIEVVGTEESGQIEIERKGFLTASEKAFVQAQANEDDTTQEVVRMTRKLGNQYKVDMQTAYEALTEAMQGQTEGELAKKVFDDHQEEIGELLTRMATMTDRKVLLQALCMLLYRVDPEIKAEDVMEAHPDLLQALSDLFVDEENRSVERLKELVSEGESEGDANAIDALEKK